MTDPIVSRKRTRLDESAADSSDIDEKPFVDHPTLYFDDGNIILTTGGTLFCVHRSLLSKHSPVFCELFEQKHGRFRCLIQITMKETRKEMEALLGIIYDGLRTDVQELTVETFPTLATLLRILKRNQVEKPVQDLVACVRVGWPATLAEHDAKQAKLRGVRRFGTPQHDQQQHRSHQRQTHHPVFHPTPTTTTAATTIALCTSGPLKLDGPSNAVNRPVSPALVQAEDLIVHPASVIGLLCDCGYTDPTLLAPLFYALSRTTWQFGGPVLGHHLAPLSAADIERLIVGIERVRACHISFALTTPMLNMHANQPVPMCQRCASGVAQLWAGLATRLLLGTGQAHSTSLSEPLEEWAVVVPSMGAYCAHHGVCPDCARALVIKIEAFRVDF